MASSNRADRLDHFYKALRKHYKPIADSSDRKVLEHLLYACCLEDASYEAADEAFAKLQQAYFDSNEIRVTTVAELSESLTSLPKAAAAATRIKKSLQSLFEARYSFDIEDLKKANLGKAVEEVSGWQGMSKFVAAYVTQHAFGGHAIPVDNQILAVCVALELISLSEADKGVIPGAERAVPKNKGVEFSSLLQQFAVEYAADLHHPIVTSIFKEMGVSAKVRVRIPPPAPPAPPKPVEKPGIKSTTPTHAESGSKGKSDKNTISPAKHDAATLSKTTSKTASKPNSSVVNPPKATKMATPVPEKTTSKAKPDAKPEHKAEPKLAVKPTSPTIASKGTVKPAAKLESPSPKSSASAPLAKSSPPQKGKPSDKPTPKKTEEKAKQKPSSAKTAVTKGIDLKGADKKQTSTGKSVAVKGTPAKSASAKPATKSSSTNKPLTKAGSGKSSGSAPPAKKSPAPAKKLPVKPVTKKKTKPR